MEKNRHLDRLVADLRRIYGEDLLSVVLHGSAARGDHAGRRSDLNVLVVLKDLELDYLERATAVAVRWTRRGNPPMLFFTPELIRESQDVFPMEFLDIRDAHRVLAGEDLFREVRVAPEHLRLQCESEIRGKLLQLRERYLLTQGRKRDLLGALIGSFAAVMTLCRGVLRLGGETSPGAHDAVIERTCRRFGLDEAPFRWIAAWKRGETARSLDEVRRIFRDYYRELRKLQNAVNRLRAEPTRPEPGMGGG